MFHLEHFIKDSLPINSYTSRPAALLTKFPPVDFDETFIDRSSIPLPDVDYDKDIISITTDSSYYSTSDFSAFDTTKHGPTTKTSTTLYSPITPTTTDSPDYFGDLFGFLFKDNDETSLRPKIEETFEDVTIPPFKNISSILSLHDILNISNGTSEQTTVHSTIQIVESKNKLPTRLPKPTTETIITTQRMVDTTKVPLTTTTDEAPPQPLPSLEILRDALLNSLSNSDVHPIHPVRHPIYQSSVPFLSPIFQAKPEPVEETKHTDFNPIRSDLDLILPGLHHTNNNPSAFDPFNVDHSLQHISSAALPEYSSAPSRKPFPAVDPAAIQTFEGVAQIFTKPSPSVGMLKLAGCNIYGRMYRVGRIIAELSSACLECRCTEVGVHCTPLDC